MTSASALAVFAVVAAAATSTPPPDTRLFDLTERTEGGDLLPYPDSAIVDADVNSDILVHLRPEALRLASGVPPTPGQQATIDRLHALESLQEKVNAVERAVLAAGDKAREARSRAQALSAKDLQELHSAFRGLADAMGAVESYVHETNRDADKVLELAFPADSPSVSADIRRFLGAEHTSLQDKVAADFAASDGTRTLELAAWLGEPPAQVHLTGYDNLAHGAARFVDKTQFNFDEQFHAEYAAAQKLAKSAADLNQLKKAAEGALRKLLGEVQASLKLLPDHATALAEAAKQHPEPEFGALKARAEELAKSAAKLRDDLSPIIEAALNPPADADPAVMLARTVSAFAASKTQVDLVTTNLRATLSAAEAAAKAGADAVRSLLSQLSQDLATILEALSRSDVAAAPELSTVKVRVNEARDTVLSLVETSRKEGDVVTIRATVFDGEKAVAGYESVAHVRVRSRGVVADTGAVVLFARGVKHDPGPFMPSAGAYAVLRFKGYRCGGDAGSPFFQVVAPGLGISAVAIPQSDGSTKFAWMGTGHLFGDVLQASFGFTPDFSPVWGFGVGLHRLAGIGAYF